MTYGLDNATHGRQRVYFFKDEDKNCDLAKAYKEAGIKVEIKKTTKAPVKKAKK